MICSQPGSLCISLRPLRSLRETCRLFPKVFISQFSIKKKGSRKGRGGRKGIKRNIVRSAIFFCFALFAGDLPIISENV
ncbi:MAG: hypothetical protein BWK80_18155 [Desulfobacteraceae bacterium IS3]|nr:MAG: hypothetical protein BWK80_18155 [Desulfobacteraceae bacterium IS3]